MLVGRCSSQLSSHKLQAKSKKSQAPTEADLSRHAVEGSAVRPYTLSNSSKKTARIENPFRIEAALDLAHQGETIRQSAPAIQLHSCWLFKNHQRSACLFHIAPQLHQPLLSRSR